MQKGYEIVHNLRVRKAEKSQNEEWEIVIIPDFLLKMHLPDLYENTYR